MNAGSPMYKLFRETEKLVSLLEPLIQDKIVNTVLTSHGMDSFPQNPVTGDE